MSAPVFSPFLPEWILSSEGFLKDCVTNKTGKIFVDACYKNQELDWKVTSRGIWYFVDNGKVVISFAHPEARVKDCFLHYALVDAVREIRLTRIS